MCKDQKFKRKVVKRGVLIKEERILRGSDRFSEEDVNKRRKWEFGRLNIRVL